MKGEGNESGGGGEELGGGTGAGRREGKGLRRKREWVQRDGTEQRKGEIQGEAIIERWMMRLITQSRHSVTPSNPDAAERGDDFQGRTAREEKIVSPASAQDDSSPRGCCGHTLSKQQTEAAEAAARGTKDYPGICVRQAQADFLSDRDCTGSPSFSLAQIRPSSPRNTLHRPVTHPSHPDSPDARPALSRTRLGFPATRTAGTLTNAGRRRRDASTGTGRTQAMADVRIRTHLCLPSRM